MAWTYSQSTGQMFNPDGSLLATGYAGHGPGVNNPAMQYVSGIGPLCQGTYTIGAPIDPPDHLGVLAMPLTPTPDTDTQGRFAFHIHGDFEGDTNREASEGCIILDHDSRATINASDDKVLVVVG